MFSQQSCQKKKAQANMLIKETIFNLEAHHENESLKTFPITRIKNSYFVIDTQC